MGVCRTAPRPPELDRIRDLIDATGGAVIQLEPLDNAAAGQLVEAALGAKPDAAAQSLFERAGGNPLFLREMVAALRHCGLTHVSAGVAGVDDAAWSVMPATVVAAVGRSLGQLPDEVGELLRRAAVLGVEFDLTELAITTGKSARALVLAVEQAVSLGLLRQADRGFAFRHPLVRYSLYEAMPVAVRDLLHRQAAEALERGGAPAERVACHVLATSRAADGWAAKWAIANINVVAGRSPETVANLIGRVITSAGFPKLGNEASTVSGALLPAHSN